MTLPDWPFIPQKNGMLLRVRVIPRASRTEVAEIREGDIRVRLQAPPVDQKANQELLRFLAGELGIRPNRLELISGEKSREKRVRIYSVGS